MANQNTEMSFFEHLEELRWHIIRAVIAIALITTVVFLAKDFIFDAFIFGPRSENFPTYRLACAFSKLIFLGDALCIDPPSFEVVNYNLSGQFIVHLQVSAMLGLILAFPYVFWEMWRFIEPALHDNERRFSRRIVLASSLLFFIGVAFGYFILTPFSVNFLVAYSVSDQVANTIALTSYISVLTTLTLASGFMFELPMVVYFLAKVGLVTDSFMREYRRHALVLVLIIAALITPPDIVSQLIVSFPLYFLFEISILIAKRVTKQRALEEAKHQIALPNAAEQP